MILNIIKVEVVGMFQNLADSIDLKSNEDVKVNKSEILKMIFTIQNVIIYILSFLVSTVSIKVFALLFNL